MPRRFSAAAIASFVAVSPGFDMTKDTNAVWSYTSPKLAPSYYQYWSVMNVRPHRFLSVVMSATLSAFLASTAVSADGLDAAPSLQLPAGPEKAPSPQGFIQRWMLLEPIGATGLSDEAVRDTVGKEHFPYQLTFVPRDGDKVKVSEAELSWHAGDTKEYNVNLFHFARALGKSTSNILTWGVTVVNCPEDMANVRLAIGSNAASIWWVNGQEVIGIYGDRQTVIDDGVSKRLTLKKAANVIHCAVVNGGGATDFCARFLEENGNPIKGYTVMVNAAGQ